MRVTLQSGTDDWVRIGATVGNWFRQRIFPTNRYFYALASGAHAASVTPQSRDDGAVRGGESPWALDVLASHSVLSACTRTKLPPISSDGPKIRAESHMRCRNALPSGRRLIIDEM